MKKKQMPVIDFGFNLDMFGGAEWAEKVEEFRQAVEKNGSARARWGCDGRTRHLTNSMQLQAALPEFEFDIDYDSYRCIAKK